MIVSFDFGSVRAVIIKNEKNTLGQGRQRGNMGNTWRKDSGYSCDVKEIVGFVVLSPVWAKGRVFHVFYRVEFKKKCRKNNNFWQLCAW